MDQIHQSFMALTFICYLTLLSQSHSTSATFSLELIPIDSLESQTNQLRNLNESQKFHRLVEKSKHRVSYLKSIATVNASLNPAESIRVPVTADNFLYVVNIGIGSPTRQESYLMVDTGSGLIWTQCQPCINCFPQNSPIYDPRTSIAYGRLPCTDDLCEDNVEFECVNDVCVYDEHYAGGSSTKGVASEEVFLLEPNTIPELLVFGCSNDNRNFNFVQNSKIGGILGLSKSPVSLLSQLGDSINNKFSYCLVPPIGTSFPSTLTLGDIDTQGLFIQSTPFVTPPQGSPLYYLNLTDISVGTHRMMFPPDTFAIIDQNRGGCIIDSGTTITYLMRTAYVQVMEQFMVYFQQYHLEMLHPGVGLDLCYRYDPNFQDYAPMTLYFQGAVLYLPWQYVYFINPEEGYFCVAMLADEDRTTIGVYQQQNLRVIYDVGNNQLQFASENCIDSHRKSF